MRDLTELKELLNPEGIVDGRILAAQTTFYEYCKLMNPKFYRDDRPYQRTCATPCRASSRGG